MANVEHYTIGCICALTTEAVALRCFLDEQHDCPEILSTHASMQDHNVYTTGSIGGHKIVIATLPLGEYGVSQATGVIGDMVRSFPNLRCCLMVGIGGGAPSSHSDVRLGDVVVSAPVDRSGGILQYDHGEAIQGQNFRVTQHLNEPGKKFPDKVSAVCHIFANASVPRFLLSAVGQLVQDHEIEAHPLQDMAKDVLAKRPRLKAKYQRPNDNSDRLCKSSVIHQTDAGSSCEHVCGNGDSELVERAPRLSGAGVAEIHYGIIASGSSLMKDALIRDRLSEEEGVLCFEMEAAGLVNQFPCLIIRGICDYSDPHKNDDWQGYAAMMAAAYTKELLRVLSPGNISLAEKIVDKVDVKLSGIERSVQTLVTSHQDVRDDTTRKDVLNWIPSTDYTNRQNALQRERQEGTGQWFLDNSSFCSWLHQKGGVLFCPGMPGAGKTHIASLAIHYLQSVDCFEWTPGLAFIYCEYSLQINQESLLGSLLEQLARRLFPLPTKLTTLYERHEKNRTQPSVKELQEVLHDIASFFERCFIVVDGLDECTDNEVMKFLLETLTGLQQSSGASILTMSRDIQPIRHHFEVQGCTKIEIKAPDRNVGMYLDHRIPCVLPLLADDHGLCRRIKAVIIAAAGGMFLLAMLQVTSLKGKANAKAIEDALAEISSGDNSLIGAYDKTMKMIEFQDEGYRKLAKRTLSWVAFSKMPLRVRDLQHALAIEPGESILDFNNITKLDIIVKACAGLLTVQKGWPCPTVRLVHETTQEYLDKTQARWFGNVRPRLARLTLTYLTLRTFESGPCKTEEELACRKARYPLYVYLRQHLPQYIKGQEEDAGVKFMLDKFFLSEMHVQAHMQAPRHMLRYFDGSTGLHAVIFHRMLSLVPLLLGKGANKPNKAGLTPLHLAVLLRFYEGIEVLLSAPAVDCNATTQNKDTALSYACYHGDLESVRLLMGFTSLSSQELLSDSKHSC